MWLGKKIGLDHRGRVRGLVRRMRRAGVAEVAIERPDEPVVEALLDAGLTVFVIAPRQLKNLRGRYGSAGNNDDRFDTGPPSRWCRLLLRPAEPSRRRPPPITVPVASRVDK